MKKLLSLILTAAMAVSGLAAGIVPVRAEDADYSDYTIRIYSNSNSTERTTWLIHEAEDAGFSISIDDNSVISGDTAAIQAAGEKGDRLEVIELKGRFDSTNAKQLEEEILDRLSKAGANQVKLDAAELEYISSAGLRAILQIRKEYLDVSIINVSPEIYEILDTTGFTEMMTVEKAYRVIDVEGCEVIGEGASGIVYRIDRDNIVKAYKNADALGAIREEIDNARLALILGIPTAIPYDVVKVGDGYGAVFELLNNKSFSAIIASEPERIDWCVQEYVNMLKTVHQTLVPEGKLPAMKEWILEMISDIQDDLPAEAIEKLTRMTLAVPDRDTMLHGDYHTNNIVLAGDEVMLIDMYSLSIGHPVFELAQMYNSFVGFGENDPEMVSNFLGFDAETAKTFWDKSLQSYLGTDDQSEISEITKKIRCIAYTRLISYCNRRMDPNSEVTKMKKDYWISELLDLLDQVDSLEF